MPRLFVDTDTASDAAVALIMALRAPGVQVDGISTVAGNVDGFRCGEARETARVELDGVRFYLTHILDRPNRPRPEVQAELRRERADVVVFGHSHLPHDEVLSGVRFFNPASAGPRRFDYPVSVGMLEVLDISLTISPVQDSTGKIVGASKIARNITDQKETERLIHENQERFRMAVKQMPGPKPVTVSVGVATFPTHATDAESLIKRADTALYESKGAGRDRVSGPRETLAQESVDRIMEAARHDATPRPDDSSRPTGFPTMPGRP